MTNFLMPLINAARLFRVAHARYKAERKNSQTQACLIWLFSFSALHRLLRAGYGSRTRLSSLGSWRPTDRLILHLQKLFYQTHFECQGFGTFFPCSRATTYILSESPFGACLVKASKAASNLSPDNSIHFFISERL